MVKSEWLPTMPLHVAIWSQVILDSDLSWADQGKTIRLLANAWSIGELTRKPWAGDAAWLAAERIWPEIAAVRAESVAKRDKLSESGRRGNEIRWRSRGESPPDSPPESPPESRGDRIQSRSRNKKQNQKQNQNQEQKQNHVVGRRGARLPDDIELSDEWLEIADRHGVENVATVFLEFVNYWTSLAGQKATKLDWTKTWENQCLKVGGKLVPLRLASKTASEKTHENVQRALESVGAV